MNANTRTLRASLVLVGALVLGTTTVGGIVAAQSAEEGETERFVPVSEQMARPDFTLSDLDGVERSISEWDGKVLLVDFWASWCIPCRAEMPSFNALREKYSDQGFEIIGIAADELDEVQEFITRIPIDFPVVYGDVFDMMDLSAEFGNDYGGLPFNVFVDREGNIRYVQKPGEVSFEEAEEILMRLL